jgi:hypothetical protein
VINRLATFILAIMSCVAVVGRSSDVTKCVHYLRNIELAKKIIATERGLTNGAPIDPKLIQTEGGASNTCPSGGKYHYGVIGEHPTCSISTHTREEADKQIRRWAFENKRDTWVAFAITGAIILIPVAAIAFFIRSRLKGRVH